jgi:hypothetical protein
MTASYFNSVLAAVLGASFT